MNISAELMLLICINIISAGIFTGGLAMSIKFIEQHIIRLEQKQDKHNNLIERMVAVEQSTKSAHHRITSIEEQYLVEKRKWY